MSWCAQRSSTNLWNARAEMPRTLGATGRRGREQRVGDVGRVPARLLIEERQRPVRHRELADADVVGELIAEVGLQIGAVAALRFGVELQLHRRVLGSGPDAEIVLGDAGRRLVGIDVGRTGDLAAAPRRDECQTEDDRQHRSRTPHGRLRRSCDPSSMRSRLFACRIPARNLQDSRCCHDPVVRVAIVAESFLPNVNGVTNSVLRVLEHLRRTGHEALVIAPDTPRGESPADRLHDGVRIHRVPSKMFPKVTSLPLGVPRPRMVGVLRGFEPDVVHLASPALLGYGGLHAARYLGVPTVAVFQTDIAGFAESYGVGVMSRVAWSWTRHLHSRADRTLAPSTSAMENLGGTRHPASASLGSGGRRHGVRAVGA